MKAHPGLAGPPKTTRPLTTHALRRPRLFRRLDRGRRRAVVWVVGSPGAGKTTLVAHYLAVRGLPAIWYQVDEGDRDVATFFHYLGFAASRIVPRARLPVLTPERRAALPMFAREYFEALYSRFRRPFALVLDDYQEAEGSALDTVLREAARRLPRHGTILVLSRAEPPPALAPLAAGRALDVIGGGELRLTHGETAGLVRRLARRVVTGRMARELHDRTGGWAAGLVLAVEGVVRQGPGGAALAETVEASTFDYFAGEILGRLEAGTRRFLLRTAMLPAMSASSAAAISGVSPAAADRRLAQLSRRSYFTERRHGSPAVYRYHPLFRRFLRSRAQASLGRGAFAALQRRAASILVDEGMLEDAVDLFAAAGDSDGLARLVRAQVPGLVDQGRASVAAGWIERLPAGTVTRDPAILYWRGVCRLELDPAASRPDLERAFRLWARAGEREGTLRSWRAVVDSILYEWGDFTRLDPWLDWLAARLPRGAVPSWAESPLATRVFAALLFRRPQDPAIDLWAERAFWDSPPAPSPSERLRAGYSVAVHAFWRGDLARASLVLEALRGVARTEDVSPLARLMWHQLDAIDRWHRADFRGCEEAMSRGLALAGGTGVHILDFQLLAQGVIGALSSGDRERGRDLLGRMADILERGRILDVGLLHFLHGWEALLGGDLPRARQEAERALDLSVQAGARWPEGLNRITMAQVLLACGDRAGAARELARGRRIADGTRSAMLGFMGALVEADLAFRRRSETEGEAALARAMAIGRERQLANTVWWRPEMMVEMALRALEAGIEVEYVQDLVRRRRLEPAAPPVHVREWPWRIRIVTLGRFALEHDGIALGPGGKADRPIALLKALIALGGREVPQARLADLLWPEAAGDAARRVFDTTLHRLRRLVRVDESIAVSGGRVSLDPGLCWVDTWAFEALLRQAGGSVPDLGPLRRAVALYEGPFLEADDHLPWAGPLRDRLRGRFMEAIGALARRDERAGEWETAAGWYQRGVEAEPLAEHLWRGLMACYRRLGRRAEALAAYDRCRQALGAALGVEPSAETTALYLALRSV